MLVVTVHRKSSTSDGHNFFVRTPFQMLLDYMEIPLSLESIHIYLDDIELILGPKIMKNSRPCWFFL